VAVAGSPFVRARGNPSAMSWHFVGSCNCLGGYVAGQLIIVDYSRRARALYLIHRAGVQITKSEIRDP